MSALTERDDGSLHYITLWKFRRRRFETAKAGGRRPGVFRLVLRTGFEIDLKNKVGLKNNYARAFARCSCVRPSYPQLSLGTS
jgi:hypothetical protein